VNWSAVRDRIVGTGPKVIRAEGAGLKSWQAGGKQRTWIREYTAKEALEPNTVIVFEPPLPANAVLLPAGTITGSGPVGVCSVGLYGASASASGAVEPIDAGRLCEGVTPGDRAMAFNLGDDGKTFLRPLESEASIAITVRTAWGAGSTVRLFCPFVCD
jgi:hypothetical protein